MSDLFLCQHRNLRPHGLILMRLGRLVYRLNISRERLLIVDQKQNAQQWCVRIKFVSYRNARLRVLVKEFLCDAICWASTNIWQTNTDFWQHMMGVISKSTTQSRSVGWICGCVSPGCIQEFVRRLFAAFINSVILCCSKHMFESSADEARSGLCCGQRAIATVRVQRRQHWTLHQWRVFPLPAFILAQPSHKGYTAELLTGLTSYLLNVWSRLFHCLLYIFISSH